MQFGVWTLGVLLQVEENLESEVAVWGPLVMSMSFWHVGSCENFVVSEVDSVTKDRVSWNVYGYTSFLMLHVALTVIVIVVRKKMERKD